MISKSRLAELRKHHATNKFSLTCCTVAYHFPELADSYESALAVVDACKVVPTVINDAITKLYPEECLPKTREATILRTKQNGGTLAYFVNVRQTLEKVLSPFLQDGGKDSSHSGYIEEIESLLKDALLAEGLKHDAERAGWQNTLNLKLALARAAAFEEAAKIADESNINRGRFTDEYEKGFADSSEAIAEAIRSRAKDTK